ncbi:hypothetical protein HMPREF0548_0430 [Lactobacillus ultunensis DSM 16047]|uniref:Uncharacterized protein n=1 Tax=Lactobacillus ultunensis DSM 16047 TaxID=525365 RepID=C2EL84_9LACO|nr:hypothetical protein HMPREF0548_0430 [Lactobacillus ultunensis DSM 16047]
MVTLDNNQADTEEKTITPATVYYTLQKHNRIVCKLKHLK